MKQVFLIVVLLISACASTPETQITQNLESGEAVTAVITGDQFVKLQGIQSASLDNQAFYEAKKAMYENLDSDQIPLLSAIEGLKKSDNPTNYNDLKIAEKREQTKQRDQWFSLAKDAFKVYLFGGGGKGSRSDQPSLTVNGDGNDLRGVIVGDKNTQTFRESKDGIPLLPGETLPIQLGESPETEPEGEGG